MRTVGAWLFLLTQFGIMIALFAGAWMMGLLYRQMQQDRSDRELLRKLLMRESDMARAAVEAVDPTSLTDRRKHL